jgi:FCP1-like phosphatase family protein
VSLSHENVRDTESSEYLKAAFLAHDPMLEVKRSYAERMEKEAIGDLVKEKRGILVLDLDHTLFQVTLRSITQEDPRLETWSFLTELEHTGRLMEGKTYWFHLDSAPNTNPFFLHLRPGMYSFLNSCSKLFELYAYTQGTSEYAKKILSGIDPKGDLFGTPFRLIAREIDPKTGLAGRKNLSRVFPNEEGLVVIVDDRDDVWDKSASSQNLIKLSPFLFFPDLEREKLFSVTPTSDMLLKPRLDAKIPPVIRDGQLGFLERLLADLHAEVFFGSSQEEGASSYSFPAVLINRRTTLFDNYLFIKNDQVNMNVFRIAKDFGAEFISLEAAREYTGEKRIVYVGVPGQGRKGTDPELIHPWFVLFCVSTFSLPRTPELFAVSRIEAEQITNIWECLEDGDNDQPDEEGLLEDLLAS